MPKSELRITAGELKNRKYISPGIETTHPMSERLRIALFNILGDIKGLSVLDAYAGSGGIGLEAASRGASGVLLIESNLLAQKAAMTNIQKLGLESKVQLLRLSVQAWLKTDQKQRFNIIIADPPYDYAPEKILARLAEFLELGGILAISLPATAKATSSITLEEVSKKSYGNSQLIFYRKTKED